MGFRPAEKSESFTDILGDCEKGAVLVPDEHIDPRTVRDDPTIGRMHVREVNRTRCNADLSRSRSGRVSAATPASKVWDESGDRMEDEPEFKNEPKYKMPKSVKDFPNIGYARYGSQYLEEKVWTTLFWEGTGGYYRKEAEQKNWSRREYVRWRSTMVRLSIWIRIY